MPPYHYRMNSLNVELAALVKEAYDNCVAHEKKAELTTSNKDLQKLKFGDYAHFYEPMKQFGLEAVDPDVIGYPLKRDGVCSTFAGWFTGILDINELDGGPTIQEMTGKLTDVEIPFREKGCMILYQGEDPNHLGQNRYTNQHYAVSLNGIVISKFLNGPIFRGPEHAQPFYTPDTFNPIGNIIKYYKGHRDISKPRNDSLGRKIA
jgi:hypothetical protein